MSLEAGDAPRAAAGATDVHDDSPTRCSRLTPDDPPGDSAGNALAADAPAATDAPPDAAAPSAASAATPVAEGRLIAGRYRVERRLGGGGMAEVFLAKDTTLGRLVAVKVLRERFADDEEFVARFHREARACRRGRRPRLQCRAVTPPAAPLSRLRHASGSVRRATPRRSGRSRAASRR